MKIVRNSIIEAFKNMPAKSKKELDEARENLIDKIMQTNYANDDEKYYDANRAYLSTLSTENLQDLLDDDWESGPDWGGYEQTSESFKYLKPKTEEEIQQALKDEKLKFWSKLEIDLNEFLEDELAQKLDVYSYGYWSHYIFNENRIFNVERMKISKNIKTNFIELCKNKAIAAGMEWDDAQGDVDFKEGWEST